MAGPVRGWEEALLGITLCLCVNLLVPIFGSQMLLSLGTVLPGFCLCP